MNIDAIVLGVFIVVCFKLAVGDSPWDKYIKSLGKIDNRDSGKCLARWLRKEEP